MLSNVIIGLSLLLNQFSFADSGGYLQKNFPPPDFLKTNYGNADFLADNFEKKTSSASAIIEKFIFKKHSDRFYFLPLETITLPILKKETKFVEIDSKAAMAADLVSGKVLYEKNSETRLPIASLTKLVSALVAVDGIKNLDETVEISADAVKAEGDAGHLIVGEKLSAKNILYLMLVSSSNDAAIAIAEYAGNIGAKEESGKNFNSRLNTFVELMNKKAEFLSLSNTHFSNPAGIDEEGHFSSAYDIIKIIRYLYNDNVYNEANNLSGKATIKDIIKTEEITVYSKDGKIEHRLKSTNKLWGVLPDIIGAKTGYTDQAGESLVLVVGDSSKRHIIITVVLNAKDRFEQSKKLVDWVFDSYVWNN